jgi:hypothetical protein
MKILAAIAIVVLVSAFQPTVAKENYKEPGVKADTKEAYAAVAGNVRQEMEEGGRYEYVNQAERKTIDRKLTEMTTLFEQAGSVAAMKEDQKIALFNAQETVNSILTRRDRDRVICKKQAPVGSHIPVTSCHTYGQEEDARRDTRKKLNDWQQTPCVGGGLCGTGG